MTAFWIGLLILILVLSLSGIVYLSFRISSYSLIQLISKRKRWLARLISFAITIIAVVLCFKFSSSANAAIILGTIVVTSLIGQVIALIVSMIMKRKKKTSLSTVFRNRIIASAAVLLSCIYLGIGYYGAHHVSVATYTVTTQKAVEPLTIVMISDLHVGTTFDGEKFKEHAKLIQEQNPDVVIVAGDFVDGSSKRADTQAVCDALGDLKTTYGVYYSYGNHDRNAYGEDKKRDFTGADFAKMLKENNITVLEDESANLENGYVIVGRRDKSERTRADIKDLTAGIDSESFIIDINHQPNDTIAESDAGIDLVLQGHTHGGQLFPFNGLGEVLGLDDITYGLKTINSTTFVVSSGIGDWSLDFKSGTRSEIVVINIVPSK